MENGAKVICSENDWFNAFGERFKLDAGTRLTVRESYRVGGALFLRFAEIEGDSAFMSTGFTPLRSLN